FRIGRRRLTGRNRCAGSCANSSNDFSSPNPRVRHLRRFQWTRRTGPDVPARIAFKVPRALVGHVQADAAYLLTLRALRPVGRCRHGVRLMLAGPPRTGVIRSVGETLYRGVWGRSAERRKTDLACRLNHLMLLTSVVTVR